MRSAYLELGCIGSYVAVDLSSKGEEGLSNGQGNGKLWADCTVGGIVGLCLEQHPGALHNGEDGCAVDVLACERPIAKGWIQQDEQGIADQGPLVEAIGADGEWQPAYRKLRLSKPRWRSDSAELLRPRRCKQAFD